MKLERMIYDEDENPPPNTHPSPHPHIILHVYWATFNTSLMLMPIYCRWKSTVKLL